jgi:hypothetical protein
MRNGPRLVDWDRFPIAVYAAHGGTAARSRGGFSFDPNACGDVETSDRV